MFLFHLHIPCRVFKTLTALSLVRAPPHFTACELVARLPRFVPSKLLISFFPQLNQA